MDIRTGRAIELDDNPTPNDRISWLVRTLFKGKQREAAREFGISQAVLSKVMRNEQVAGQRVLAAIASNPRINAHWLYTGGGSSLVPGEGEIPLPSSSEPTMSDVGPTLPVAGQFLPGSPAEYSLLLTRKRMPIASPDFATTRYFLELAGDAPILRAKCEKVAPGDCLLMETNRRLWIDHPPVLNGRLMVVRFGGGQGPELVLARGGLQPDGGYLHLDDFGISKGIVKLALRGFLAAGTSLPHSPPDEATSGPLPSPEGGATRSSKPTREKAEVVVQLDDIASICVMLIRS